MITDADIKKMKAVFVTKEDLKQMSDKFENKFATKDDLKVLESRMSTNLQRSTDQLVDLITIGFSRTEKAIERLSQHDEIIDNHEHRLDRIEDKIFA